MSAQPGSKSAYQQRLAKGGRGRGGRQSASPGGISKSAVRTTWGGGRSIPPGPLLSVERGGRTFPRRPGRVPPGRPVCRRGGRGSSTLGGGGGSRITRVLPELIHFGRGNRSGPAAQRLRRGGVCPWAGEGAMPDGSRRDVSGRNASLCAERRLRTSFSSGCGILSSMTGRGDVKRGGPIEQARGGPKMVMRVAVVRWAPKIFADGHVRRLPLSSPGVNPASARIKRCSVLSLELVSCRAGPMVASPRGVASPHSQD